MLKIPATRAAIKEMHAEILAFLEKHPQAAVRAQDAAAKKGSCQAKQGKTQGAAF
jgi:hypothetical protein